MRIFYALNFADHVKTAIYNNIHEIKKYTARGNFTLRENFHITLLFIGECMPNQLPLFKKIADAAANKINTAAVTAYIDGLGSFARTREELVWVGIKTEPSDILQKINSVLTDETLKNGIRIKDSSKQRFTPHITIARRVEFRQISGKDLHLIKFEPVNCTIDSVTLMESVSIQENYRSRIIYKPLYEAKFANK